MDDEFVNWFSICGSAQKCTDSLGALIEKGLDHVNILGGTPVADSHGERWEATVEEQVLFAKEVIPVFKN